MSKKLDLALRLAGRVLTLPPGSWAETQQAENDLDDALWRGMTHEKIMKMAAKTAGHVHPDRMEWLKNLAAETGERYPALS